MGSDRTAQPSGFEPIDPAAPVSGHQPPPSSAPSAAVAPEHDWDAARELVMPSLRPAGTGGLRLDALDADRLAVEALRDHATPVIDDGPAGLVVVYTLDLGRYEVMVSAAHLLAWGIDAPTLRAMAMGNLSAWSHAAAWVDEVDGGHVVRSSDTGDGLDAARILLPEVRRDLLDRLALGHGSRVLVALPERHLLVATALAPGDEVFGAQFGAFAAAAAADADQPIDPRPFELSEDGLRPFVP